MKLAFSFLLNLFLSHSLLALPLDSKFLGKVLGISDSKKTILINKGNEIGLKVGNHAKISLPSGFVARAMVVKLSPSRSVWSIYRFVHKERLQTQVVFRFKISSPVKLTSDESKSLGILAKRIDQKPPRLKTREAREVERQQKAYEKRWIQTEKRVGQLDGQNYSSLEDDGLPRELDRDIDWSALDGHKDQEHFDTTLNYSRLK